MSDGLDAVIQRFDARDLPIGVYFVEPDGRFRACNAILRQMLGFPAEGDVAARSPELYADPSQRERLLQKAIAADARRLPPEVETIELRVGGRALWVEDHCKPLRDPATGAVIGFVGCLVDVTAERESRQREESLRQKVDELTLDIGRVLHANSNTLVMAQQTLDGVAEALTLGLLPDSVPTLPEEADERLVNQALRLANAIERFVEGGDAERRAQALPADRWAFLATQRELLANIQTLIPVREIRVPTLRKVAHEVGLIGASVPPGLLPREPLRHLLQAAVQVEQTACLIDVRESRNAVIQMDLSLRTLRDFVTDDVRAVETKRRLTVKSLIEQTLAQLAQFAQSSQVEIEWRDRAEGAETVGNERDLLRALANLLHNAVKYTWRRERTRQSWVKIATFVQDRQVVLEFENWGVPISQDEVEGGLIFQLGYRGKWATDRGRLGTGIGLTDAQRVAEAHGGTLHLASRPASPYALRPDADTFYQQPFITTATLRLPLAR